jgi:hypothetical protein
MSDNVISIASRLPKQRRVNDAENRSDAAEAKHRADDERRLHFIRKRYADNKGRQLRFKSKEDKLRAARALGFIVKGSQETIAYLNEEWSRSKGGGPLHLHRYMISPDTDLSDPKILAVKANKLPGLVRGYAKRAQFIAGVSGKDVDEAEKSLFRETSIWSSAPAAGGSHAPDEAADHLAFLLQELSNRVIRKTDLMHLFDRMRRVPGVWDFRRSEFRPGDMACLFRSAYQDWNEHWTEAPPLPSAPLVRIWHAGWQVPVRLEARDDSSMQFVSPVRSEINLYREIRLAIGPTVNKETLGPMFESRAWAELTLFSEDGSVLAEAPLDPNCDLWAFDCGESCVDIQNATYGLTSDTQILPDVEEELAQIAAIRSGESGVSGSLWEHTPLADEKQLSENYDFSWTPSDALHVMHWLDRNCDGRAQPVELLPQVNKAGGRENNWYPKFVLGSLVTRQFLMSGWRRLFFEV